jgi:hypothetical protein
VQLVAGKACDLELAISASGRLRLGLNRMSIGNMVPEETRRGTGRS